MTVPTATALEAAYEAGHDARVRGEDVRACPYDPRLERALVHAFCNGYVGAGPLLLEDEPD